MVLRIWIIGAGAIGLLYGLRLARSGAEIIFYTRTKEQAAVLNTQGAVLKENGKASLLQIKALPIGERVEAAAPEDWIWITVKQPHMDEELLGQLAALACEGASVLSLQNGIGHLPVLHASLPHSPIYAGITTEGALRHDLHTVDHTGIGQLAIGLAYSPNDAMPPSKTVEKSQKMLRAVLDTAGIDVLLSNESKEMESRLYQKLLINAVVNPLTAIYGVKNGELPKEPLRRAMMAALHRESAAILQDAGLLHDPEEESWDRLMSVCSKTAANESSMLRDVKSGRLTEIQWINGGIRAIARQLNQPSPLNDAVIAMVQALERK